MKKKIAVFGLLITLILLPCLTLEAKAVQVDAQPSAIQGQSAGQAQAPEPGHTQGLGKPGKEKNKVEPGTLLLDEAGLLQPGEKSQVIEELRQVEEKYRLRIAVRLVDSLHGKKPEKAAREFLRECQPDEQKPAIVLLVAMASRDYYIEMNAPMSKIIDQKDTLPLLLKSVQKSLSAGDNAGACRNFAGQVAEYASYYQQHGEHAAPLQQERVLHNLALAALLALIGAWLFRSHLISQMHNVRFARGAHGYMDPGSLQLTHQADVFVNRFTTSHRISKGSGSGSFGSPRGGGGFGGGGKF